MQAKEHTGSTLKYLTVEPDDYDPSHRYPMVVLLHGFGAYMGDLASLSPAIDRRGYVYAFPNAPIPLHIGYGIGYAWASLEGPARRRETEQAEEMLEAFLDEVAAQYRVEPGNIVLGGFSQGGIMAYYLGLPQPERFRGIAALSSRLDDPDEMAERLPVVRSQAIFMTHGDIDEMIEVNQGRESRDRLVQWGYDPKYHEYPDMGHEIDDIVVADLTTWLKAVLPPSPAP